MFVVETFGGFAGYLAIMGALAGMNLSAGEEEEIERDRKGGEGITE